MSPWYDMIVLTKQSITKSTEVVFVCRGNSLVTIHYRQTYFFHKAIYTLKFELGDLLVRALIPRQIE